MTRARWQTRIRSWSGRVAVLVSAVMVLAACSDDSTKETNPLDPKGDVASRQIGLLEFWMIPAGVIGVLILAATVYVALRFRERPGNENPVQVHGNSALEIGWTIVPALIMVVMAVPTVSLIWDLDASSAELEAKYDKEPLEVIVYGKQWWWEYQYTNLSSLDGELDFQVNTANELHIPANRPVHFTLRSDNVIHSFWVPSLAGKKDVVPGRDNEMWFIAEDDDVDQWFYGQCVEYCGLSHADMRLKVKVHSEADFITWAKEQNQVWSPERAERANELLGKWGCASCHYMGGTNFDADVAMRDGTGANARPGPNLTHLATRTSFAGAKYDLCDDNGENCDVDKLAEWVLHAGDLKPMQCDKPVDQSTERCKGMPNFEKSGMTPEEARAIAEFLLEEDNVEMADAPPPTEATETTTATEQAEDEQ